MAILVTVAAFLEQKRLKKGQQGHITTVCGQITKFTQKQLQIGCDEEKTENTEVYFHPFNGSRQGERKWQLF